MPSGIPEGAICVQRFDDSQKLCNSHYLSHFAAFFIDARTKRSVVESFIYILYLHSDVTVEKGLIVATGRRGPEGSDASGSPFSGRARQSNMVVSVKGWRFRGQRPPRLGNDPSAGSPTERFHAQESPSEAQDFCTCQSSTAMHLPAKHVPGCLLFTGSQHVCGEGFYQQSILE